MSVGPSRTPARFWPEGPYAACASVKPVVSFGTCNARFGDRHRDGTRAEKPQCCASASRCEQLAHTCHLLCSTLLAQPIGSTQTLRSYQLSSPLQGAVPLTVVVKANGPAFSLSLTRANG
jgi:hypothetical protein